MNYNTEVKQSDAINSIKINRLCVNAKELVQDCVIVEKFFILEVYNIARFEILCTPVDVEALAVGMLFEWKIIESKYDIECLEVLEDMVKVKIRNELLAVEKYNNFVKHVDSGLEVEFLFKKIEPNRKFLKKIEFSKIIAAMATLHQRQEIFIKTGAAHAALIFNAEGEYFAFAEDIGRHNALDKVIGKCILAEQALEGCALALSSRVSFEMAAKAARAGIELVAAVSAPSSLAVAAAKYWQMTLCGFVRNKKANIYCGEERIVS